MLLRAADAQAVPCLPRGAGLRLLQRRYVFEDVGLPVGVSLKLLVYLELRVTSRPRRPRVCTLLAGAAARLELPSRSRNKSIHVCI